MEIEQMRKQKYGDGFSCAITAASATIGPVFPPSIPMIIYSMKESLKNTELRGVIPALITQVNKHGDIDLKEIENQARYLSTAGVNGFFIGGTTGEGAYLQTEQKNDIFKTVKNLVGNRQFLYLACIKPSTKMVLQEMEELSELDPDYIIAVTPFYYTSTQEQICEHFITISNYSPKPLILYDIPGNTQSQRSFSVIQGEDYLHGPFLFFGDRGMVTGLGNVRIEPYIDMFSAAKDKDYEQVKICQ